MNAEYKRLKKEYDEIAEEISRLYDKQNEIHGLMQEACTHENTKKVEPYCINDDIGFDDEEAKYKCQDCYQYFTKEQLENQKI